MNTKKTVKALDTKPPAALTRAEFARHIGVSRAYVGRLAAKGRLVLADNGKDIMVAASIDRMEKMSDPAYAPRDNERVAQETGDSPEIDNYSRNKALREYYAAQTAKLEYEQLVGTLCETSEFKRAGNDVGTLLRTALENMADDLAPALAAEKNEDRVHALLVERHEQMLRTLSDRVRAAAQNVMRETA